MYKQPLFVYLSSLISGIFFQECFRLPLSITAFLLAFALALSLLLRLKHIYIQKLRILLLIFFFFSAGVSLHALHLRKPVLPELEKNQTVVFKVFKKLNSTDKNRKYIAEIFADSLKTKTVLSVPKSVQELDFAHYYKAKLFISIPEKSAHHFQFDYQKYLSRQDIYLQSYLPGELYSAERTDMSFIEKIKQNRHVLLQKIENSQMSSQAKNFVKGIILADRTDMDRETVRDFNTSGLVHFLAISGTHIVIIYWIMMLFFKRVIPVNFRSFAIILSLIGIWFFGMYIGFGNSVVRSCIMITVFYIFILLQRKPDLLHSLCLSGLIILFINTQELFDLGFQLSFLAVAGIYWFNDALLKFFPPVKTWLQKIVFNTITVSVSAQLATIPLVLYYFHQFSWMSLPANLLIIPFSEFIIIFSLLVVIMFGIGIKTDTVLNIYEHVVHYLLKIVHWFADQDFANKKNIPMTLLEMVLLYALIYFVGILLKKFNYKKMFTAICILASFVVLRVVLNINGNKTMETLETHYFKQKIVIVKKTGSAEFYMKPSKNIEKINEYIINPYLSYRRITKHRIIETEADQIEVNGKVFSLK